MLFINNRPDKGVPFSVTLSCAVNACTVQNQNICTYISLRKRSFKYLCIDMINGYNT